MRAVLLVQSAITLLAGLIAAVSAGIEAGWAALMGGGICLIVTAYFARKVFAARPGSSADRVARAFYLGEVVKWVLTGGLFAVALVGMKAPFLPLILGYTATQLGYWLVLPLKLNSSQ